MSNEKLIKILTDVGLSLEEAKKKVDAVLVVAKEVMPKASDEEIHAVVAVKLKEFKSASKDLERMSGACLSAGEMADQNGITRDIALRAYAKDKEGTIRNGLVGIIKGEPEALDTRKYLDNAETMENRGFGKKLPVKMQREMLFAIDGDLCRAFGSVNPEAGVEYTIFGKRSKSNKTTITIPQTPGVVTDNVMTPSETWNKLYEAGNGSEAACSIADALNPKITRKNQFCVIIGLVQHIGETGNGDPFVILTDEDAESDTIACFNNTEIAAEQVAGLSKGNEIAVVGKIGESKNKDEPGVVKRNLNVSGYVLNPDGGMDQDVLEKLNSVVF